MPSFLVTRALEDELVRIVGRESVLTQPGELVPFESDALTAYRATPAAVVFVHETDELQAVVSTLRRARVPFVPRGAGTGLSGGAVADGAVLIELARMNRVLWVDAENRRARVQPGVVNMRLAEAVAPHGLMYAPDPSSQTACTLGGNVAENAGGPHCLKYGVTSNHVLGLRVVTPDGQVIDVHATGRPGYDLVGLLVGSEGTLGICSEIEVRLVPRPAAVETLLAHFDAIEAAGRAVSAIVAAGILPAAIEMIDRETIKAVEASVYAAGFPTDVAASLIVELDGPAAGLAEQAAAVEALLRGNGAREVARAASEADRVRFWKARKSAFGAMGRIAPDLMVQDATVPRSRLPDVLDRVCEIARKHELTITNVFHAGDGNLHPNIPYDRRDAKMMRRVQAAGREIMEACVAAGGTITGEHGVGIDKRDYMPLIYSQDDRQTMHWVKQVFDEAGLCNPGKLLPREQVAPDAGSAPRAPAEPDIGSAIASELGSGCLLDDGGAFVIDGRPAPLVAAPRSLEQLAGLMTLASRARWAVVPAGQGTWLAGGFPLKRVDLVVSTMRLGTGGGGGGGGRGGGGGAIDHAPDDLLATVSAGVTLDELNARLARGGQWWPLDPPGAGTVGATIATGSAGPLAASYGTPRDLVLGLTLVRADGRIVRAGGRVVKNVAGYDMVRLYTGSWGTLGIIAEAHLRLCPLPAADETRVMTAGHPGQLAALAAELSRGARLAPAAAEIVSPAGADALGQRTGHWRMAVRWLGHEAAVADAVAEAKGAAARSGVLFDRREGVWKRASALEERLRPGLSVRVDVPPRAIEEMIPHATLLAGGEHPPLQASPLTGRMWIFVPAPLYEATKSARLWALRLAELRRAAEQCGGGARVELAPASLRGQFDPWGEVGATLSWQAGLKRRFDPDGILKTGFFVGGL